MSRPGSDRPRVFVTRIIPRLGLDLVRAAADAEVWEDELPPPRHVLLEKVRGIDGLLSLLTDRVDAELLDAAGPQLRVVSNFAVGYDNIDVPECTRRGVAVGNTPGVLTETTADLAFALLMAVARRLPEARDHVREDRWRTWGPMLLLGKDIHGATLGLVGFGRIGREMARRASGFGMRTLYHDVVPAEPEVEQALGATDAPLETLLAECGLREPAHGPLGRDPPPHRRRGARAHEARRRSSSTRAADRSSTRTPSPMRCARAICSGPASTSPTRSPCRADHPLVRLPNCLVVPHIASASEQTRDRMAEKAARNLMAGLRGEPLPDPVSA